MTFRLPRLTRTKGMARTDPFARAALKLYRLREEDPCGHTWPCKDDDEHTHRCTKHRTHGIDHKCNCGAVRKRAAGR